MSDVRRASVVGSLLLLTVVYAVLQVGFVRPHLPAGAAPNLARPPLISPDNPADLQAWRDAYRAGPPAASVWKDDPGGWARTHFGMVVQVLVFTVGALALFVLRHHDLTAQLCVLALALSGVAGGGSLQGVEYGWPLGLGDVLTVFSWLASPFAFPIIALAIMHFPSPSPMLARRRWLYAIPFLAAAPMLLMAAATALYLVGVDRMHAAALWDAAHPGVYFASFALALGFNVFALLEGVHRYNFNHDGNERRRIRMAVYTAVPGVVGYAIKDGVPIVAMLAGMRMPVFPWPVVALLQFLVLLPAFGLPYAVGVARVLGPALVIRRSLQYALANRALAVITLLPAAALVYVLLRKNLVQILSSGSIVYLILFVATVALARYRERARQWLDERFFREEYDARKILLSLASRVRFETDPRDLASLVVQQIDQALHPEVTGMLASGISEGEMVPVTATGRELEPLALDGGLVTMLRWSDDPLEIFLDDPRSPARRLPAAEIAWLERTGAALLVPVLGQERALVAVLVLGGKRSEEAYSKEDRELLASIAAQVGLGLDVARLRRRVAEEAPTTTAEMTRMLTPPMAECPRCGRCEDHGVTICPGDGAALRPGATPRVIDNKYRIDQLLGRGGMGAVYRSRDVRLDRQVAVKVVRPELLDDNEARRRFRREAQLVARLQHPGIVSIFDFGTLDSGGAYLVMELIRGEDLRRVLQREGRLEPARAERILTAVCGAIEAAHQEGVLHRDLKPENILLPGGSVEAKVLDFGVAKLVEEPTHRIDEERADLQSTLTMAGTIIGTPAYMAPEQLRAAKPGPRTDIFALGVIAYEMLTGDLPFGRGSLTDVVLAQARGARRLRDRDAAITPPVDDAVMRALSMDPDARPSSAQAFAREVRDGLGAAR
ncbi:MAG TPA: protein kinase [Vicinamibacterales bacterium]|nr:protein kinase [Vicinamibacterales bacterium]